MKKIVKRNQVIITSLAILIAVAGYLNFADVDLGFKDKEASTDSASILDQVDYDITDESALLEENSQNRFFVLGELGRQYFAREGLKVDTHFHYTVQDPSLHRARLITDTMIDLYQKGELDEIYIIYTRMENSMSAVAEMRKLLPLSKRTFTTAAPIDVYQEELKADPSWDRIVELLVPNYVNGFIYGALVESYASEHNSRMMAMQSATNNAEEMLKELSVEYNRVRQAAITQEITEVIGGAKALKKKKKKQVR